MYLYVLATWDSLKSPESTQLSHTYRLVLACLLYWLLSPLNPSCTSDTSFRASGMLLGICLVEWIVGRSEFGDEWRLHPCSNRPGATQVSFPSHWALFSSIVHRPALLFTTLRPTSGGASSSSCCHFPIVRLLGLFWAPLPTCGAPQIPARWPPEAALRQSQYLRLWNQERGVWILLLDLGVVRYLLKDSGAVGQPWSPPCTLI